MNCRWKLKRCVANFAAPALCERMEHLSNAELHGHPVEVHIYISCVHMQSCIFPSSQLVYVYVIFSHMYFIDIDIFIYIELFSCHITTIQTVNVNDNVNLRNASTTASIAFWAIRNASLCQDREINTADQRKDRRETHDGATNLISVSFVALDSALQDVPKMRQRYEIYSL